MSEYEVIKLRKQVQRQRELIKQEKEDRENTERRLVQVQADRDRFHGELVIARQTIENVDQIIAQNIREMKAKLQQENAESFNELQKFKDRVLQEQLLRERLQQELKNKETVISELSLRLREMSRKYKDPSLLVNTKEIADQAAITNNNYYKLTEKYNKVCGDMENIMAENKILRKLHGVPENFGFDLEEIKIAEKQELEDYKAQCRRLESEIEELQGERTQLRYRLRQYNTLFSNKGERYKDMNQQQLELLDQYAMNLKEGKIEIPQIDKSQREMEKEIIKLKAQIQILQSKATPSFSQKATVQGEQTEKLSIEALRKLEEQFSKLITPLREDMRKITADINSHPHGNYEVNNKHSTVNVNIEGTQFRPPMPLPVSHNDWSNIKQGYSYMYNSKIPIDLKDMTDEGGFNIAKAKYEVAALQLQNIESLKLLKERQNNEDKLFKELQDLRAKYQQCLKVQDDLFMRYFKEKEEDNQRMRKLEIENNSLEGQKQQLQTTNAIITDSFNALSKKTQVQKKCQELTSRLAISQAELMKMRKKYEVVNEEHKMLRQSYTHLQAKTAQSQYSIRQKLAYAKKNEKELTFYLNKILDEKKGFVSAEVHKAVLSRNQALKDRSVNSSIKQTELRLRINKLENIEREINIKEDIIETLREDNFDINLELEIVKNRLENTDADYKIYMTVFRRLINFINQNNISVMNYFKKFDKDGSGQLGKNEFISAIKALGFEITNNEFQLMFNEFDLDGSQSITYGQFLRKMRRSGVYTKNKEEEALYRLFKAIKQANFSIRKAFQIIDMDGSNEVSKTQMETAFRKIGIDITMNTIDYIFKMCDDDLSGTISCSEFEKLFESIVRESAIEQKEVFGGELDWKLAFVLKMQQVSVKYNKGGLQETFRSLDSNGNACLTINQFQQFFTKAGIQLQRKDLLELFQFLDRHRDQKVEYHEFLRVLEEAKREKKRTDRVKYIRVRTEELRKENQVNGVREERAKVSEEKAMSIKLMSLQTKHASLLKKTDKLIKTTVAKEQQIIELNRTVEELERNVQQIRDEFYKEKEAAIKFEEQSKNRIGEEESRRLKLQSGKLRIENVQLKNEVQLYKSLFEKLSTKNKNDEMRIVKIQSQVNKSYEIVKDLQSVSDMNAVYASKVYELEVSKRNEEIVNKKYDELVEEVRVVQAQNVKLGEESMQKEREIINTHFFMQEKAQLMQRNIDELTDKIMPTVSANRIQDILLKIRDISNSKTELQKQNKDLRQLNFNLQIRNDYIENEKVHIEELQKKLRRTYTDEASLAIIDLTKKLSEYKMGELKAKRECGLLKEKEEYYLRVNNTQTESIKEIEEELANWEKKFNEREEFWRKRLSEQMKLMEDIQKEAAKNRQEELNADRFFKQKERENEKASKQYESLPEERQLQISSMIKRAGTGGNEGAVLQLKSRISDLQQQLLAKEKEIYQLKATLKEIVPQAKFNDFAGQMSVSTTNFLLQTDLTTSQLKNNARRFINNQRDQENYYKDEATKLTQAAQQSIDTLQRIIDDKNEQLKRKQQIIENLKKEFLRSKEEDCKQIQVLNEQIRELKIKAQSGPLSDFMARPTSKNFYPGGKGEDSALLRQALQKKDEELRLMQEKYDKLYISKEKRSNEVVQKGERILERKLEELQGERESERKRYLESEERLNLKIKNLEKLTKEKDVKLTKLQKTLLDLKKYAVDESAKIEDNHLQEQINEALTSMNKGKTANDSKMEITLQKALQTIQDLTKQNKQYEHELRRLKEEKLSRTSVKK